MNPADVPLRVSIQKDTLTIHMSDQEFHFSPHTAQRLVDQMSHNKHQCAETRRLLQTLRAFAQSAQN